MTYCFMHGKPAKRHRLKYPQPPETPKALLWEPPGPALWLCPECSEKAALWAEEAPRG